MTMIGASIEDLLGLGQLFDAKARMIDETAASIERAQTCNWIGPDAQAFAEAWKSNLRPKLVAVGGALSSAAETLQRNATEQQAASGGNRPLGGPSIPPVSPQPGGGSTGDRTTNVVRNIEANGTWQSINAVVAPFAIGSSWLLDKMGKAGLLLAPKGRDILGHYSQLPGSGYQVGRGVQALNAVRFAGTGLSIASAAVSGFSAIDKFAHGDVYGGADSLIAAGLAAGSLLPPPAGLVSGGLSLAWSGLQALSGGVPVTKRIADGASAAWNWATKWIK